MMTEFAFQLRRFTRISYDKTSRRLRCLAHIINLATQAFIKAYSKAKCYNPHTPDEHVPDLTAAVRDVIGLVRAICVKERSSAKRKEIFRQIQAEAKSDKPLQLILDMVIRWSSTYAMLYRGYNLRDFVNEFVRRIAHDEKDAKKSAELERLALTPGEWARVKAFVKLLRYADAAQQAFSSDEGPSMHLAIPALESIHRNWEEQAEKISNVEFKPALDAGLAKIEEYYNKVTDSEAYLFCMLLDPSQKLAYFNVHWDTKLQLEVLAAAEKIVCFLSLLLPFWS
ncbi:ribonuclease H-like domain-containing protein [Favolaschia claudopus]|uniref:Ribonuclease H-like domain-containing protein n=1 Tax=Favolaschia claudopus TaxID=2862362 RepID=A0AAV9ZNB0_9AGAR